MKLFAGKLLAIPERYVCLRFVHSTDPFYQYIEIHTKPDVHFDGPKMDEKGFGCLKRT